jgi:hypothetical protein
MRESVYLEDVHMLSILVLDMTLPLESVSHSRSRIGLHGLCRKPVFLELHRADIRQRRVHARLVVPEQPSDDFVLRLASGFEALPVEPLHL